METATPGSVNARIRVKGSAGGVEDGGETALRGASAAAHLPCSIFFSHSPHADLAMVFWISCQISQAARALFHLEADAGAVVDHLPSSIGEDESRW